MGRSARIDLLGQSIEAISFRERSVEERSQICFVPKQTRQPCQNDAGQSDDCQTRLKLLHQTAAALPTWNPRGAPATNRLR